MSDFLTVGAVLLGLWVMGHALNSISETVYWFIVDWKNKRK